MGGAAAAGQHGDRARRARAGDGRSWGAFASALIIGHRRPPRARVADTLSPRRRPVVSSVRKDIGTSIISACGRGSTPTSGPSRQIQREYTTVVRIERVCRRPVWGPSAYWGAVESQALTQRSHARRVRALDRVLLALPFALLIAAWLVVAPRSPDLAAQTYRAGLFETSGFGVWDDNWYGGHHLPGYSLVFPWLALVFGMRAGGGPGGARVRRLFERIALAVYGPRGALGRGAVSLWRQRAICGSAGSRSRWGSRSRCSRCSALARSGLGLPGCSRRCALPPARSRACCWRWRDRRT